MVGLSGIHDTRLTAESQSLKRVFTPRFGTPRVVVGPTEAQGFRIPYAEFLFEGGTEHREADGGRHSVAAVGVHGVCPDSANESKRAATVLPTRTKEKTGDYLV